MPYENQWCTTNLPLCSATHLHSLPTYIDSYPEAIRVLVVAYVNVLYDMDIESGAMGMVYTISPTRGYSKIVFLSFNLFVF